MNEPPGRRTPPSLATEGHPEVMTATETTLSQIADVVPLRHGLTALYFRNRELRRLRSLSPEQRQGQAS